MIKLGRDAWEGFINFPFCIPILRILLDYIVFRLPYMENQKKNNIYFKKELILSNIGLT